MLEVTHLRKEFTNVVAVDDVSFSVARGQVFGLIGPNGAGKSTTIRMIMDIIQPDRGEIRIDGRIGDGDVKNLTGYLPEERGLYRKNKLGDVIAYFASLKGLSRKQALAAAAPWLERFGLTPWLRRNVEELSKGNQQKVQFIIALLHMPKLLVLDELFSGLDPVNQVLMKDALMELKADNRAIIFSTHQMEHAERLCDELVMIHKGRMVLDGSPAGIKGKHGRNSVQLSYTGDGSFLRDLPDVVRADIAGNFAELELAPGTDNNALLATLLPRLEISSFARVEPSLNAIFIDIVGLPRNGETDEEPEVPKVRTKTIARDPRVRKTLLNVVVTAALFLVFSSTYLVSHERMQLFIAGFSLIAFLLSIHKFREARASAREERDIQVRNSDGGAR